MAHGYIGTYEVTGRLLIIFTDNILFGRYQILKLLGTGAFGRVYLARHINLNVLRAIKCINLCQDVYGTAYREADILKNLRHPSIPIIYDIEQDKDCVYIIEEYVEGQSLAEFISTRQIRLNRTGKAIELVQQLCGILSYLHERHILHLDLKPENIIISDGGIRLLDYGNALHEEEEPEVRMGTRGFASPEMYGREKIEAGSDVYSLGVILLYIITGKSSKEAVGQVSNKSVRKLIESCIYHSGRERIGTIKELSNKLTSLNKKFVEDVSISIHVGSIREHCGCTHSAILLNRIMLKRGYKSIICEKNNSEDFFYYIRENDFVFDKGIFKLGDNELLPEYHGYVKTDFLADYNRIIKDFGYISEDNLEEFISGDMICILTDASPGDICRLEAFLSEHREITNKKYRILINLSSQKEYRSIIRKHSMNNCVRVPFEPDAFYSKKDWLT